jgi:hypothetical protein
MTLVTLIAILATGAAPRLAPDGGDWTPYGADQQAQYAYRLEDGGEAGTARVVIRATPLRQRPYAFAEMDYRFDCANRTATAAAVRTLDAAGGLLDEIVIPEGRVPPEPIEVHVIPLADPFAAACPARP